MNNIIGPTGEEQFKYFNVSLFEAFEQWLNKKNITWSNNLDKGVQTAIKIDVSFFNRLHEKRC